MKKLVAVSHFLFGSICGILVDRIFSHYYGADFEALLNRYPNPIDGILGITSNLLAWMTSEENSFWLFAALTGMFSSWILGKTFRATFPKDAAAWRSIALMAIGGGTALLGVIASVIIRLIGGYVSRNTDPATTTLGALVVLAFGVFAYAFAWEATVHRRWPGVEIREMPLPKRSEIEANVLDASRLAGNEAVERLRSFGMSAGYAKHLLARRRISETREAPESRAGLSGEG